jgi:hypothetical protein
VLQVGHCAEVVLILEGVVEGHIYDQQVEVQVEHMQLVLHIVGRWMLDNRSHLVPVVAVVGVRRVVRKEVARMVGVLEVHDSVASTPTALLVLADDCNSADFFEQADVHILVALRDRVPPFPSVLFLDEWLPPSPSALLPLVPASRAFHALRNHTPYVSLQMPVFHMLVLLC